MTVTTSPPVRGGRAIAALAAGLALLLPLAATPSATAARPAARGGATVVYGVCGGRDLCAVDPATRKVTRVRRGTAGAPFRGVSATPSGRAIAFLRGTRIFRAGPTGAAARHVGGGLSPLISPDGRNVTWRSEIQTQQCDAFGFCNQVQTFALFLSAPGQARPTIVEAYSYSSAWWGARLASQNTRRGTDAFDIAELDADGNAIRVLTDDPTQSYTSPAFSPDGRLLAVVAEPLPQGDAELRFKGRIALFDPATAKLVRVLTESADDDVPAFSPDGRQVAFNCGRDLYVVPVAGGSARRIARGFALSGPSWARAAARGR